MEISVYLSLDCFNADKKVFCQRVACPDVFNPQTAVSLFKSIFGKESVVDILFV